MLFWIIKTISILYSFRFDFMYSIVFRSITGFFFALFISLGIGNYVIKKLHNLHMYQIIRSDGPQSHMLKQETPTMGGVIMLISAIVSIMMWTDLSNKYVWYIIFTFMTYGLLGLIDDLLKVKRKNSLGLSVLKKYFWQSVIAIILVIFIFIFMIIFNYINVQKITVSVFKEVLYQLNIWDIVLAYFVIVGTSNSVNLSDGLDGLAIVPIIFITIGLAVIALVTSNFYLSNYLNILYIDYVKELVIICAIMIGSSLGFLWFNTYPAQIFMGDVGSLSFGGVIGLLFVLLRQEYLLLIMGGIFIIESLSVLIQVSYFKIFKRRVFKMTPIHHHFELKGYSEPQIIVRFWIISLIFVLLGLVILIIK